MFPGGHSPPGQLELAAERRGPASDAAAMGRDAADELRGRAVRDFSMNRERRRRALITRPQEDAAAVAVALDRRGITPMLAPMMQTKFFPLDISADVGRAQSMLFTSRNGVRALPVSDRRDVKVFAVGDSTADL